MAHTVDGDGDALGEDKAIRADEGRNLVEGVGLEELLGRLGGVDLDLLKLEVVGLRDGADGRGAGVALRRAARSATARVNKQWARIGNPTGARFDHHATYRVGEELSERHLCLRSGQEADGSRGRESGKESWR